MKTKRLTSKISVNATYISKDDVSKLRRIISEHFCTLKAKKLRNISRTYIDL